jgi:hypothetical protein
MRDAAVPSGIRSPVWRALSQRAEIRRVLGSDLVRDPLGAPGEGQDEKKGGELPTPVHRFSPRCSSAAGSKLGQLAASHVAIPSPNV